MARRGRGGAVPAQAGLRERRDHAPGREAGDGPSGFFAGAEAMAQQPGFKPGYFWRRERSVNPGRLSRVRSSHGIRGLIIAPHGREMGDALRLEGPIFSAVTTDGFAARGRAPQRREPPCDIVRLAMQQVREAGYRRIGFVVDRGSDRAGGRLWTRLFGAQRDLGRRARLPRTCSPRRIRPGWSDAHPAPAPPDGAAPAPQVGAGDQPTRRGAAGATRPGSEDCARPRAGGVFIEDFRGATAGVRQNHWTVAAVAVEILAGPRQHDPFGVPEIPMTTCVEGSWSDGATCPRLGGAGRERARGPGGGVSEAGVRAVGAPASLTCGDRCPITPR